VTATVDHIHELRRLLPPNARPHDTQRITADLARALERGWTVAQLARECSRDLASTANAPAVVAWRIHQAADREPPTAPAKVRQPLCGRCEDGFLVDPTTKLPIRRCDCRKAAP